MSYRKVMLIVLAGLAPAACTSTGIPALGLNTCNLGGIGIGTLGGALAGGLIGRNWTGAAVGGAVGGALGFLTTKVFAHQLGCDDQKRLDQDTRVAAAAPIGHHISYAPAPTSDGRRVSGYVMPVSSWYTDAEGHRVRDVRQVLTDGDNTQTSTVQVAATDVPAGGSTRAPASAKGDGYVLPK